jgi:hypothetical protein
MCPLVTVRYGISLIVQDSEPKINIVFPLIGPSLEKNPHSNNNPSNDLK